MAAATGNAIGWKGVAGIVLVALMLIGLAGQMHGCSRLGRQEHRTLALTLRLQLQPSGQYHDWCCTRSVMPTIIGTVRSEGTGYHQEVDLRDRGMGYDTLTAIWSVNVIVVQSTTRIRVRLRETIVAPLDWIGRRLGWRPEICEIDIPFGAANPALVQQEQSVQCRGSTLYYRGQLLP